MRRILAVSLGLMCACTGKAPVDTADTGAERDADADTDADTDADSDADSDSDTDADTDADTDTAEMPADPSPFTLTLAGAVDETLLFDAPSCSFQGSSYRMFWRNADPLQHVYVLVAEVIGSFTGVGTYDQTVPRTVAKLQEEAGGSGAYFVTDATAGDTLEITVEHVDDDRTWGSFTFSSLTGDPGAITATPQPVPIWCPDFQ